MSLIDGNRTSHRGRLAFVAPVLLVGKAAVSGTDRPAADAWNTLPAGTVGSA